MVKKIILLALIVCVGFIFVGCDPVLEMFFPEFGDQGGEEPPPGFEGEQNNRIAARVWFDYMIADNFSNEGDPILRTRLERWNPGLGPMGEWERADGREIWWPSADWDWYEEYHWLMPNDEYRIFAYWDKNNNDYPDANEPGYFLSDYWSGQQIFRMPNFDQPEMFFEAETWIGYNDSGNYPTDPSNYDMWTYMP